MHIEFLIVANKGCKQGKKFQFAASKSVSVGCQIVAHLHKRYIKKLWL